MHRFLIAAASAAFVAAVALPALADDSYPPCTQPGQDHCRVVPMHHGKGGHHHHGGKHHGHHHGGKHHKGGSGGEKH